MVRQLRSPLRLLIPLLALACGAPDHGAATAEDELIASSCGGPAPHPWKCGGREPPLSGLPKKGCSDHRWVGLQLAGPRRCLAVTGTPIGGTWKITRPYLTASWPSLQAHCIYEWEGFTPTLAPDISVLPDDPSMRLERDCQVVSAMAIPDGAWQPIAAGFANQLDLPSYSFAPPAATSVRVAVLDSVLDRNDGNPSAGKNKHGEAVADLVRRASQVRTPWATQYRAELAYYLALPLENSPTGFTRPVRGGDFGSQEDAAYAVFRAIEDFKLLPPATNRLILNLSLGWDEVYGGEPGPYNRVPARLVRIALEYAACHGALNIAAAGNRNRLDGTKGPLYPAAFERQADTCAGYGYAPLVHAIGGVDARDQTLGMARELATPRLSAPAAFGLAAHYDFLPGDVASPILSGTSVAAAVSSGAAALLWSTDAGASGHDIMQRLYDAGELFGGVSHFGLAGPQKRRRLNVCRAAATGCVAFGCPNKCRNRPSGVDATADFKLAIDALLLGAPPNPVGFPPGLPVLPTLEPVVQPYSVPQPGDLACPLCGVINNVLVGELSIPNDTTVDAVVLHLATNFDKLSMTVDIADPSSPFEVPLPLEEGTIVYKATMEVAFAADGETFMGLSDLFVE